MGRYVLAEDYVRALRGREVIAREIEAALAGRDALLCPTMPVPAPPLGATMVAVGDDQPSPCARPCSASRSPSTWAGSRP